MLELNGLLDHCHRLRDCTHEALVAVLRQEGRLDALKPVLAIDSLTGLRSRAAIEMLLERWWRDDPTRHRLASVGLVDIDRLSAINECVGPAAGDRLIGALANLARDSLHHNRGHSVIGRFAGQQFLAFLGDTGPHGATTAVERLRQTVEAATLRASDEELRVQISCGVTEVYPGDTAATLFARVQKTLRAAKAAGGNRTVLHDGARPTLITPPSFSVVLHMLRLDSDAVGSSSA
jgi:diguanylate cyclase (GGDEF)-like protein